MRIHFFWVDLRQKKFFPESGLKFLAEKIFEKMKSSLNPFISFLRQKYVDSGGLSDFYFLLKTNMGQYYLFRTN